MPSFAEVLDLAHTPETIVPLCLRGDLVARLDELEQQLDAAQTAADQAETLASPAQSTALDLARQVQAVQDEMRAATVPFRLRGLTKAQWDALVLQHAPRDGDQGDRMLGFNRETLFPACARACLVDPKPDSDEQWQQFVDRVSAGQVARLGDAAYKLSTEDVEVPFVLAASAIIRASGAG